MAAEYTGFAGLLKVDISSTYTTVAQVRDINGPNMSRDVIEVTSRDSAGQAREFLAGLLDNGEVTFDIVYDPDTTTHSASAAGGAITLLAAGSLNNFRVEFSDTTATTATFAGIVTGFEPKMPLNDAMTADVTIKVSGQITWA